MTDSHRAADSCGDASSGDAGPLGVVDRDLTLALEELGGRHRPPDQLAAILRRTNAGGISASPMRRHAESRGMPRRLAAVALLALTATCAIGLLARQRPAPAPTGSPATAPSVVAHELSRHANQQLAPQQLAPKKQEPQEQEPQKQEPQKQEPKKAPKPEAKQEPTPKKKGTDAADLRAQRSAEAMLAAEKKLAQMLKDGKIAGVDEILPFEKLTSWKYEKGLEGCPEAVRKLDGKKVLMTGFMLPIDEVRGMHRFLLVKSLWACCFGSPPDINGIVRCAMPAGKTTDYLFEPLKVVGTLRVSETVEDGYCVDIYQLNVDLVEVIE